MPHDAGDTVVLRRHKLAYIPQLAVDGKLLRVRFSRGCAMNNCKGDCCRYGVWVDVQERDRILAHAALIQRHMEAHQEKNPAQWFEPHEIEDPDFPSGRAAGTQERQTGCVFLDSRGRCVLQTAATAEGLPKFFLKPFFCASYPVTIEDHTLTIDDREFPDNPNCCSAVPDGEQNIFDVCREELQFALGEEGYNELCRSIDDRSL